MEIIVFENESFYRMQRELIRMFQLAIEEALLKNTNESDWINEEDAKKILPYKSKKKWAQLRKSGVIRFMQVGRKISYSKKSIMDFMSKHSTKQTFNHGKN